MSIGLAEFCRLLPKTLLAGETWEADDGQRAYVLRLSGGTVRIFLQEEPMLRLGKLALPSQRVRFSFEGLSESDRNAWISRFWRTFQRGGG